MCSIGKAGEARIKRGLLGRQLRDDWLSKSEKECARGVDGYMSIWGGLVGETVSAIWGEGQETVDLVRGRRLLELHSRPAILSDDRTNFGYLTPEGIRVALVQNVQSSSNRKQCRLLT